MQSLSRPQPRASARPALWEKHRDTLEGYAFLAPFLLVYLIFLVYPFFKGIWMSLHEWNLLAVAVNPAAKEFVGLQNYQTMLWGRGMTWSVGHLFVWRALALLAVTALLTYFVRRGQLKRMAALWLAAAAVLLFAVLLGIHPGEEGRWWDRRFGSIVVNTFVFVVLTVPSVTALGLALAVALNRSSPIMTGLRTIFFLSYVLSVTVVTLIWQLILSPQQGIIANILTSLGAEPIQWITSQNLAMPAIVMTTVWWASGFAMVLFLAGLQEIPAERYEAATLDGAGPWAKFRYITWPGLTRTTTLVIIVQTIMHFQVFGQSHLITRGGPDDATQVLVRYIYQTGFRDSDLGYASTLAVFLFAIMMIFSVLQLRLQGDD